MTTTNTDFILIVVFWLIGWLTGFSCGYITREAKENR